MVGPGAFAAGFFFWKVPLPLSGGDLELLRAEPVGLCRSEGARVGVRGAGIGLGTGFLRGGGDEAKRSEAGRREVPGSVGGLGKGGLKDQPKLPSKWAGPEGLRNEPV